MALKYFTNAFKGNASDSIVINPDIVASVYENFIIDEKTKKNVKVTMSFCWCYWHYMGSKRGHSDCCCSLE
jgi:hypothetical protein